MARRFCDTQPQFTQSGPGMACTPTAGSLCVSLVYSGSIATGELTTFLDVAASSFSERLQSSSWTPQGWYRSMARTGCAVVQDKGGPASVPAVLALVPPSHFKNRLGDPELQSRRPELRQPARDRCPSLFLLLSCGPLSFGHRFSSNLPQVCPKRGPLWGERDGGAQVSLNFPSKRL